MNIYRQILILVIIIFSLNGCERANKFNSDLWKSKGLDWWMTDTREKMVDDLVKSDTLIGLNKSEIIQLLGKPERINENKLSYLIREKYSWDIDPEYISYLNIEFDKNALFIKCEIKKEI